MKSDRIRNSAAETTTAVPTAGRDFYRKGDQFGGRMDVKKTPARAQHEQADTHDTMITGHTKPVWVIAGSFAFEATERI
ncbi:MAG TPA: hypothetical protein VFS91_01055 [Nitrobacter sp.]|nr:hypothetical protein [Nitrobacter sp.]